MTGMPPPPAWLWPRCWKIENSYLSADYVSKCKVMPIAIFFPRKFFLFLKNMYFCIMKQIVEKIKNCSWLRSIGGNAAAICHSASLHLKNLGLAAVCLGAVMALVFVCSGVYDLGYNILVAMPPILIIGGTAAVVAGIKKDGQY